MKKLSYPINIVVAYIPFGDKLLLNKRIDEPYKGMWALAGGHLELGETIEECIVREVKEETALDATFIALRGIASEIIYEQGTAVDHFILWICEVSVDHDRAMEQREGAVRWFSRKEMEANEPLSLQRREYHVPTKVGACTVRFSAASSLDYLRVREADECAAKAEFREYSRLQNKDRIIESDYLMLHNFIFKEKSRLDVHKVKVQKDGEAYKVEYFGL